MNNQPIIVLARQRSGTTVFRRTLAKTKTFEDFDEIFHPILIRKEAQASFHLFKQRWLLQDITKAIVSVENQKKLFEDYFDYLNNLGNCPFYLIDIKYNIWHHFNSFWQDSFAKPYLIDLIKERKIKIIHIIRKNVFKQTISLKRAIQTKQWQLNDQSNLVKKSIIVNPESCIHLMNNSISNTNLFQKYFKGYEKYYLELYYEEMYKNNTISDSTKNKLTTFLNYDFETNEQLVSKKIINDLNLVVSNKNELLGFFRNTSFYDMVKSSFT